MTETTTKVAAPAIQIEQLTKRYQSNGNEIAAVCELSLDLPRGKFVSLEGNSGSGKSTLLFILAGLLAPDTGKVLLDGTDPYQLSQSACSRFRARSIGMVFQDFRLLPYLDVRQNILAPALAVHDLDPKRADTLIGELGLDSRKTHRPKQLSAGEQQRTALARALLSRPKILLADEPTGNLDTENTDQVLTQLKRFASQGGTVLTATHDPTIAAAADLRLRIDHGKLVS